MKSCMHVIVVFDDLDSNFGSVKLMKNYHYRLVLL
jgi:peptidyl-tRNA hydrolase